VRGTRTLRLYLLDDRTVDLDRVTVLIDRLAARREVGGGVPEWSVRFETADISEAMRVCAAELSALDPRWYEILDFKAQPAWRQS
jgi:hypothetical protein